MHLIFKNDLNIYIVKKSFGLNKYICLNSVRTYVLRHTFWLSERSLRGADVVGGWVCQHYAL